MALKHHTALQAGAGDFAPVHEDVAGAGTFQARQHVQDRRLATAAVADDADEFALRDAEVEAFKNRFASAGASLGKAFDLEELGARFGRP